MCEGLINNFSVALPAYHDLVLSRNFVLGVKLSHEERVCGVTNIKEIPFPVHVCAKCNKTNYYICWYF